MAVSRASYERVHVRLSLLEGGLDLGAHAAQLADALRVIAARVHGYGLVQQVQDLVQAQVAACRHGARRLTACLRVKLGGGRQMKTA
jgi:hypothetical protein